MEAFSDVFGQQRGQMMACEMNVPDANIFLSSQFVVMSVLIIDFIIIILSVYKMFVFSNHSYSVIHHLYSHMGIQAGLNLTVHLLFHSLAPPARSSTSVLFQSDSMRTEKRARSVEGVTSVMSEELFLVPLMESKFSSPVR